MRTVIDGYTHNVPPTYLKQIANHPNPKVSKQAQRTAERAGTRRNMIDWGTRLADMDKYGFTRQVTCIYQGVDPNHLPIENAEEQIKLCKIINDDMADAMKIGGDRVFALGTAPLRALESGGVEEMRRAIKDLGLRGFMAITNVDGVPVDHLKRFWDEASSLGVPVYLHPIDPVTPAGRPYEDEFDLMHVLGWPFETSLTMARLVMSGTMERNPSLRVVAHHLGGMIPFFSGRINESYDKEMIIARPEQRFDAVKGRGPAIEHFKGFYYDTAIGGNKLAIEMTRDLFGAEKIIFGTDYPFGPRDGISRLATYPKLIEGADFSQAEKAMIFEENISKLLRI